MPAADAAEVKRVKREGAAAVANAAAPVDLTGRRGGTLGAGRGGGGGGGGDGGVGVIELE